MGGGGGGRRANVACSRSTHCQAFRQPTPNPATISINVQENRLGNRPSIQTPSAKPSKVGTTIDHPTSPNSPNPNQRLCCFSCLALSLRDSWAAIFRMNLARRFR